MALNNTHSLYNTTFIAFIVQDNTEYIIEINLRFYLNILNMMLNIIFVNFVIEIIFDL
jgi:hypothetical protein